MLSGTVFLTWMWETTRKTETPKRHCPPPQRHSSGFLNIMLPKATLLEADLSSHCPCVTLIILVPAQSGAWNSCFQTAFRGRLWGGRDAGYLHSGLREVHPAGEVFPHEGVGVVGPLKDALQGLQLAAVEGRPVPPLLSLLLLLRVQLIVWNRRCWW